MNGKSNDATVIDPATATAVATIPMGGRPEYAVADGKGMIYDNIEDKDEVVALDSARILSKPTGPSPRPEGPPPWKWTSNIAASSSAGATGACHYGC